MKIKSFNSGKGFGGGMLPDWDDPEFLLGRVFDEIKDRQTPEDPKEPSKIQRVIDETDLEEYFSEGWEYLNSLNGNSGKCVVVKFHPLPSDVYGE